MLEKNRSVMTASVQRQFSRMKRATRCFLQVSPGSRKSSKRRGQQKQECCVGDITEFVIGRESFPRPISGAEGSRSETRHCSPSIISAST